ncbi:MAG: pseudouridine synthase [Bacteroidota bacterium]
MSYQAGPPLPILYQDDYLVAINKPHGLPVHRSPLYADADRFALQSLRDQIGQRVHPLHRLDRKTSGVLLFALDAGTTRQVQQQFLEHSIEKRYLAIVRGWFPDTLEVDYALTNDRGVEQTALTRFRCLQRTELQLPFGKFQTSRYSLIEARPQTGRTHQIRKHCKHVFHPIIGDRPHGCNKQNRLFLEKWNMTTTMLHAQSLQLRHPVSGVKVELVAECSDEFRRVKELLKLG